MSALWLRVPNTQYPITSNLAKPQIDKKHAWSTNSGVSQLLWNSCPPFFYLAFADTEPDGGYEIFKGVDIVATVLDGDLDLIY